ncbi:hypothetical protein OQA88_10933 [Cercophora sp. LCS_1]
MLPYDGHGGIAMFPGPPADSPYAWTGPTTIFTARGVEDRGDPYGLWLANTLWALLGFGPLSRGFGLIVYEGVLDAIEFWVDGQRRPTYDMDGMLARLESAPIKPENMAILVRWRDWLASWKRDRQRRGDQGGSSSSSCGSSSSPSPSSLRPVLSFPRYRPKRSRDWDLSSDANFDT